MAAADDHMVGGLAESEPAVTGGMMDLFAPVTVDETLIGSTVIKIKPTTMSHFADDYHFKIAPRGDHYVHPTASRLLMRLRIVKSDGSNLSLAEAKGVAPINGLAYNFFKTMSVELKGATINHLTNTHCAYKNHVQNLLSYGRDSRESHMRCGAFSMDTPKQYEEISALADGTATGTYAHANRGFMERSMQMFDENGSKSVEFSVPLTANDFFQTRRAFPSNFDLVLKCTRYSDAFLLMCPEDKNYKIKVEDITLFVKYIEVNPAIVALHKKQILTNPLIYPIKKTQIFTREWPADATSMHWPEAVHGYMPKSLFFGVVSTASFQGKYPKNPLRIYHYDASNVSVRYNTKTYPTDGYKLDFKKGLCMEPYRAVFDNAGMHYNDGGCALSYDQFLDGASLFCYDFSPEGCNMFHMHPTEKGAIDINIDFATKLPEVCTLVVIAVYDAVVHINQHSDVVVTGVGM